jgi:ubiquinone biosynthesis protein
MSEPATTSAQDPPRGDLAIGAFTDDGPWEIDLDHISWRAAVPEVRRRVSRELPDLVRPRKLPPGLRVVKVARHIGLGLAAWALMERRQGGTASRAGISRRLREAAEALGPTYIKLGQIIS